jgi:hypothetical protein
MPQANIPRHAEGLSPKARDNGVGDARVERAWKGEGWAVIGPYRSGLGIWCQIWKEPARAASRRDFSAVEAAPTKANHLK